MNTILLAFAFVFFVFGAIGGFIFPPPNPPGPWWRFNPVSAGLACWVFTEILHNWPK